MIYHRNDPKKFNMVACVECGHIKPHMLTLKTRGAHHEVKLYLCIDCLHKGAELIEDNISVLEDEQIIKTS